ncbi:MAG: cadmium-translocating P-type ATPase [Firmicutes bacterium]|nr:cadmium-translocating P-type ATPase [Bacillota bacterium]
MIKEFTLQGLNCVNCAAKIEQSVKNLTGVSNASVNFITSLLSIELSADYAIDKHEHLYKEIKDIVYSHEPDVLVLEKTNFLAQGIKEADKKEIWWISAAAIIFICALLCKHLLIFKFSEYFSLLLFLVAYVLSGGRIILGAGKNILKGNVFDENFLMSIATIGAIAIGQYAEAVGVMLFYQVGEFFQELAVNRSKKTINKLLDIRPDYANLQIGEKTLKVSPESVEIGATIIIKPGERIPLDGVVIHGEAMLDTTALTGESIPRRASVADTVLSGCINLNGVLTVQVTQIFGNSTVSKIIDLIENAAAKKAPTENFITKFAKYYTPIVVSLALLIALLPPLLIGVDWLDCLHRALIFLVISCPCALVISIPLSFFGGIGSASKKGILVKGGNYLEALTNLDIIVFDKTGTLTKGVFAVTSYQPQAGFTAQELLKAAAYAEVFSNHPIALSIIKAYNKPIYQKAIHAYQEIAGRGVRIQVNDTTIIAGNKTFMDEMNVETLEATGLGTKVYIAIDNIYMGYLTISDEIRQDSYFAINALKELGIRKAVMLSGDSIEITEAIGNALNIDEVHGALLPQDKVKQVELLKEQKRKNGKVAFVGDGINDAPVLALADIGVAMGGLGSDAAIEAADIVLMTDEPSKLTEAVIVARSTKRIVIQNIVFALSIKTLFLVLGAIGFATMWEAVFADVGVALLAVLNAMRVLGK